MAKAEANPEHTKPRLVINDARLAIADAVLEKKSALLCAVKNMMEKERSLNETTHPLLEPDSAPVNTQTSCLKVIHEVMDSVISDFAEVYKKNFQVF